MLYYYAAYYEYIMHAYMVSPPYLLLLFECVTFTLHITSIICVLTWLAHHICNVLLKLECVIITLYITSIICMLTWLVHHIYNVLLKLECISITLHIPSIICMLTWSVHHIYNLLLSSLIELILRCVVLV